MTAVPAPGKILDASALVHIAVGKSSYARAVVETAVENTFTLAIPAPEVAAALVGLYPAARDLLIDRILGLGVTVVIPVDLEHARAVGAWLAESGAPESAGLDSTVWSIYEAAWRGWPILTATASRYRNKPDIVTLEILP